MEVEDTGTYENNDMDMEDMREITEVLHNGKALRVGRHMDNHQFFFLGEGITDQSARGIEAISEAQVGFCVAA